MPLQLNFGNLRNLAQRVSVGLRDLLPFTSFLPGPLGAFARSPIGQASITQATGRQYTEELEAETPQLQRFPTGDEAGPAGISLPQIYAQGVRERQAAFGQATQLATEQRNQIANFRSSLGDSMQALQRADATLASAGLQGNAQLRQGLASLNNFRRQTMAFISAGIRTSMGLLNQVKEGNKEVLDSIDNEITNRGQTVVAGIEARNDATFNEHLRALESSTQISPEERTALRAYYDRQTGSDAALALGQLHAAAAEFKGTISANLQTSYNSAASYTAVTAGRLLETGVSAFANAENIAADLRKATIDNSRQVAIARSELAQFGAELSRAGETGIYNMISTMTRPVLVVSDLMFDIFDTAWDAIAYNNQVEQQELANRMAILNPQFQGSFDAVGILARDREFSQSLEAQEEAGQRGLYGNIGGSAVEGAFTGLTMPGRD